MKWDLIKGIKIFKVIEHFNSLYIYPDLTIFERQKLNEIDRRINEQKATKSHPEIQIKRKSIEIAYNILKFAVGSDIQFKIFLLVFSFFSLLFRLPVIFQFVSVCTTISAAGKSVTSARKSCPSADFVKRLFIRRCCLIIIG